jgi:YrbI family 3-deoxy-D-manno-octulosonate 8-phosphate phosphatase
VLDHSRDVQSYDPDLIVFLQATSPLRGPHDIDNAINTLRDEDADSLFSACPVQGFVWRHDGKTVSSFSYDYRNRQRRQDAPQDLIENGSIYVFRPWVLRRFNNRLGGKIAVYPMSVLDSWQVDEEEDLHIIEKFMSLRRHQSTEPIPEDARLLVVDFDGVMTDNRVQLDQDGNEFVWCNRADGWGIDQLKKTGMEIIVISTESNPVVSARCMKLGIDWVQDCSDKLSVLKRVADERGLRREQIIYIGNDENDLECMRWVGFPVAVADAEPATRKIARLVTERRGGKGAVREVCDLIIRRRVAEESLSAIPFGASR